MMVDQELLQAIGQMMDTKLEPIQQDISSLKTEVARHGEKLDRLETEVGALRDDLTRVAIIQENKVLPPIQLLAEGQSGLAEKLKKVDDHERRLEDVENKVDAVTIVTRQLQKQRHSPERER